MSRYVDADKAKNGIMKFVNEYGEIVGMFVNDFNILLERCAADVEPRWIPVTEGLPEKSGTYLASTNMGDVGLAECDWDYEDGMYLSAEYLDVDAIVAWMPLPEPYKEGE